MSKSLYSIKMDFNKANNQAQDLDNLANKLRNLANNDYTETLASIRSSWEGNASDSYQRKGNNVKNNLLKRATELSKAASTVRQIAKNTYDAEMHAYQLAQQRKK